MKKLLSLIIVTAIIIIASPAVSFLRAQAAFSSSTLSNPSYTLDDEEGFIYKEAQVNEGGAQKIFYGEYNPTAKGAKYQWVLHSVRNQTSTTLTTVMNIAKDYEEKTGNKVIYAANGDYFDNSGSNIDSYVVDGVVIKKGNFTNKHCIGFDNKGKVAIGRMTETRRRLSVVIKGENTFFDIDKFNEEPIGNEIAVYNEVGTYTVKGANKVVVRTDNTNLNNCPVWGQSATMTDHALLNDEAFTLRSGQFAIVTKGENAEFFYKNKYGVEMNIIEVPAGDFEGCTYVVGGYDVLVNNGVVGSSFHTDNGGNSNAPRTFIGAKEDGTIFLCEVDGRQPSYSIGITVKKEAELAKALGAKYALELDGGGSTTAIVRINDVLTLRNKPSDGSMRRVSNAVMLVEAVEKETPNPDSSSQSSSSSSSSVGSSSSSSVNTGTSSSAAQGSSGCSMLGGNLLGVGLVLVGALIAVSKRKF